MVLRSLLVGVVLLLFGVPAPAPMEPVSGGMSSEQLTVLFAPDSTTLLIHEIAGRFGGDVQARSMAGHIIRYARIHHLAPNLVVAVVLAESGGNARAVSSVGALGLMQVYPRYWQGIYPECGVDLFDVETNICYGTRILRHYLDRAKADSLSLALNRYSGYIAYGYETDASPYTRSVGRFLPSAN